MNIFIFRRDLRVQDNTGLNWLNDHAKGESVLPIFIFDPSQIDSRKNPYFSHACVEFMHDCLASLARKLPLQMYTGQPVDILKRLKKAFPELSRIVVNADYTPFSRKRDAAIQQWCGKNDMELVSLEDLPLGDFHRIRTAGNKPYKRFRYFCQKTLQQRLRAPCTKPRNVNIVRDSSSHTASIRVSLKWLKKMDEEIFQNTEHIKNTITQENFEPNYETKK